MTTLPAYFGGEGSDHYRYGPFFDRVPARTYAIPPSRSHTDCPICGKPVDVRGDHAVVQEQIDGRVVAGCFAHLACCEPLTDIRENTTGQTDDQPSEDGSQGVSDV